RTRRCRRRRPFVVLFLIAPILGLLVGQVFEEAVLLGGGAAVPVPQPRRWGAPGRCGGARGRPAPGPGRGRRPRGRRRRPPGKRPGRRTRARARSGPGACRSNGQCERSGCGGRGLATRGVRTWTSPLIPKGTSWEEGGAGAQTPIGRSAGSAVKRSQSATVI